MDSLELKSLIQNLIKNSRETEWLEFKHNFHSFEEIGENISALANGACLLKEPYGYLIFGVQDLSLKVIGTTFQPSQKKKGGEDFEHWLINRLSPRIDFRFKSIEYEPGMNVVVFIIPAAKDTPISFLHKSYVKVGSYTKQLQEYPEKQRKIWANSPVSYEEKIAIDGLSDSDIVDLLETHSYFKLMNIPYPSNRSLVLQKLEKEKLIQKDHGYSITTLGALLFANKLEAFEKLNRKAVRVIIYNGNSRIKTEREQIGVRGYAVGFNGLVNWLNGQLPANEEVVNALRIDTKMYPEIAVRELVANALIHQDLTVRGFPMVEVFSDRMEISNPGEPLLNPDRFIDGFLSRNEGVADIMRRLGFCEERGSGLDKVIASNELYQLPPLRFEVNQGRTKVSLFSYRKLGKLSKEERIRACYQHACLKYVSNEKTTNTSLRERFKIENHNYAKVSRIIREALDAEVIKESDPNQSRKYASYVPFWA